MKKSFFLTSCLLVTLFVPYGNARAQENASETLHVIKSGVNADSENAELCVQFDLPLAPMTPSHLASMLKLESDGKKIIPANIEAAGTALCLFPLEHDKTFHLELAGLRGAADEKMAAPYSQTFTVPDRPPSLAFTGKYGGVNSFGSYDNALTLRSVNTAHVKLTLYRVSDVASMARAWQDRAQTALAPSESAYLARNKGQQVWQTDLNLEKTPNVTIEEKIILHDLLPDLAPGLYLIVADAGTGSEAKSANRGLSPLAVAWLAKSNFSMRAFHDAAGIHVYASKAEAGIRFVSINKKPEEVTDALSTSDGSGLILYPPKLEDTSDMTTVIGVDPAGNVAFADNENLPPLTNQLPLGLIQTEAPFMVPGGTVDAVLTQAENAVHATNESILRLTRRGSLYQEFRVNAPTEGPAHLSFLAPPSSGLWDLLWQKADGTPLASSILHVTSNGDAPHLESSSERDFLTVDAPWPVTIKSIASSGKPAPLIAGRAMIAWQEWDPSTAGWKDFRFGTAGTLDDKPLRVEDFLTDLEGTTQLHLNLPKAPSNPGLYQAVLTLAAETDSGVARSIPFILPLHPETTVIGIKPLMPDARFAQNGIARFALLGLASDGKPREVNGLSYQIYEEGRSFGWFQNEGQWKYKPEPQLRPIGGGPLAIKADGSSILEWPVTAGNYRLEILDANAKTLAQSDFSAGWDTSSHSATPYAPLNLSLPKVLEPGQEVTVHFTLPFPSMLTVLIADQNIEKSLHEVREKGPNDYSFIPSSEWKSDINMIVQAEALDGKSPPLRSLIETRIAQTKTLPEIHETGLSVVTSTSPSGLQLHKDGKATAVFALENNGDENEIYHYSFSASPGLKIENGEKGSVSLGGRQSRAIEVTFSSDQIGTKELRLEVLGAHIARLQHTWNIDVLPKTNALRSLETTLSAPKEILLKTKSTQDQGIAFISKRPMDGLGEILSSFFASKPFTTEELALTADALRLWGDVMAQSGIASEALISATREQWISRLLLHQNDDGGFANLRGGESTLSATASALLALGPLTSEQVLPAKNLAIGYLKQRLSNTWFDEKERTARAAAYAGLAAAGATDPASLHYFSDTSATDTLDPLASANIAGAFKQIHDPNAAAFWIKKMLDQNNSEKSISLLNALAATDALSSDDVHKAMGEMSLTLRAGKSIDIKDAAGLLRAIAIDNIDAGNERLLSGSQIHDIIGVAVLHTSDPLAATYHNGDNQNLFVTFAAAAPTTPIPSSIDAIGRHIYKLNGTEISGRSEVNSSDIYVVELKGTRPELSDNERLLIQDGDSTSIRPIGCALPTKLETLSFVPWLGTKDLSPFTVCEKLPYSLSAVLDAPENDEGMEENTFRLVYFAHIDAKSTADIAPPHMRILNEISQN